MDKITNLKKIIIKTLDSNKALDIVSIDLKNKSSMADHMIIATPKCFKELSKCVRAGFQSKE